MNTAQRHVLRKKRVHAERIGNVRKACRYLGVSKSSVYVWKKAYEAHGEEGLINRKPCPANPCRGSDHYKEAHWSTLV